ncbi:MAG: SsrA-binding protein SmpB [Patescibacteria group bacterium]
MKVINRSAFHDYTVINRFEAGIKLTGAEVKSAKGSHVSLVGAFIRIMGTEVYLINAQIHPYSFAKIEGYDPRRTRKLLLSKKEILSLKVKIEGANLTLIPLSLYTSHGLVKVEVGLVRGKKQYEKRETLKKRDALRELELDYRNKID